VVRVFEQESSDGRVHLRIEGFVSTCPFSKVKEKDRIDLELTYTPGHSFDGSSVRIDPPKLERDLASYEEKEGKEGIPMEVIPIEILKRCVEPCVSQRRGRNAGPEEVEIRSASASLEPNKGKDWGIVTIVGYKRQVSSIIRRA